MSDEQLMARVVEGSMEALGQLFERHKGPLFGYLARLLHDQSRAEDVLVEAFFRLYDRRQTFRFGCKFSTWLYAIAHHLAIDQMKREARRQRLTEEFAHQSAMVTDDTGLEEMARAEMSAQVRRAVQALPPDQRAVIILRVYHEMSYREIAEITSTHEETVRVRAHRARQALKGLLGSLREDDVPGNVSPPVTV